MTDTLSVVHAEIRARYADFTPTATDDELAEMRRQYRWATVENNILVDGVLRVRCGVCRSRPVPVDWASMQWCDECLDELKRRTE